MLFYCTFSESTCIDWQAHDGATALLLAIRSGSEECVHILLDGNANLNISEHMGITPLIAGKLDLQQITGL